MNYIATAAHCLSAYNIYSMQIAVGVLKTGVKTTYTDYYNISQSIVHPLYVKGQDFNDIALVRTLTPIVYSNGVNPVCLPFYYPWVQVSIKSFPIIIIMFLITLP